MPSSPLPRLRVGPPPATADVVIVGGGIVGCATAFFAARAGLRVVVLERHPALATLTTPASTGAFRLQFDNPQEVELVREGIGLFDAFAERTGLDGWEVGIRHGGYLFCSLTDATVDRARDLVTRQASWGLTDVELLTGDDARARWPWLSPDVRGARFRAGDGWLDVKRLSIGYALAASDAARIPDAAGGSATFCLGTEATAVLATPEGSRIRGVATSAAEVAADQVVLATGPFLARLAGGIGLDVPIAPTRRQKLVIPELPDVPQDAPVTIHEETAAHWRPYMRGCLALYTEAGTEPSEPQDPVPVSSAWAFGLLDPRSEHALARVAPFWRDGAPTASWSIQAGQYEVTPDRRPLLGPAGPDGLYLNGGYSGHGIMAGAAGSRIVVDLIMGRGDPALNPFRVDRQMEARPHDIL